MTSLLLAAICGTGTWLVVVPSPSSSSVAPVAHRAGRAVRLRLDRVGLVDVTVPRFLVVSTGAALAGGMLAALALGPGPVALGLASVSAAAPASFWLRRHRAARRAARDHWPRLLEELRVQVGPVGRSIPQALIEVGSRAPDALRPAFAAAQREWNLRTDLERMLQVLAEQVDDPTADATCETLIVIHQVGGDLDPRLADLAADRRRDLHDRREADARQSGARLARWFVVVVPLGMGFAGLNVGDGAAAYRAPGAELLVGAAVALVGVCWWWTGRLMRLPDEPRVFAP